MIFFKKTSLFKSIIILILLHSWFLSYGQLHIDTTTNIEVYKKLFFNTNSGVKIENFIISGNKFSVGHFQNYCKELEIRNGIILSTGNAIEINGPNDKTNSGANLRFPGDKELNKISNGKSFDAVILEFDFTPNSDSISFDYIFASEEYPEYVKKGLNDSFAFFLSEINSNKNINLAKLPNSDLPITVDNINSKTNNEFFIANTDKNSCIFHNLQFDGLSKKLSAGHKVAPYQKYHLRLCISDVGDGFFDSAVFLRANSFQSSGKFCIVGLKDTLVHYFKYDVVNADTSAIVFMSNVKFDFNSSTLGAEDNAGLDSVLTLLKKYFDFNIAINGYSDNIGSKNYNLELSYKRAENIANYLINNGIKKERIKIKGFGINNPIANNNSSLGRMRNRRVTFELSKQL